LDDQSEKNEIGGACGMDGGGEKFIQGFWGKCEGKETTCHLEDSGIDGEIILRWIFGSGIGGGGGGGPQSFSRDGEGGQPL